MLQKTLVVGLAVGVSVPMTMVTGHAVVSGIVAPTAHVIHSPHTHSECIAEWYAEGVRAGDVSSFVPLVL